MVTIDGYEILFSVFSNSTSKDYTRNHNNYIVRDYKANMYD